MTYLKATVVGLVVGLLGAILLVFIALGVQGNAMLQRAGSGGIGSVSAGIRRWTSGFSRTGWRVCRRLLLDNQTGTPKINPLALNRCS